MCYINGQVIFYKDNSTARNLLNPSTFDGNDLLRIREIKVVNDSIPKGIPFSEYKYGFLHAGHASHNFVSKENIIIIIIFIIIFILLLHHKGSLLN